LLQLCGLLLDDWLWPGEKKSLQSMQADAAALLKVGELERR